MTKAENWNFGPRKISVQYFGPDFGPHFGPKVGPLFGPRVDPFSAKMDFGAPPFSGLGNEQC